jgi:leucyl aminopeptidase
LYRYLAYKTGDASSGKNSRLQVIGRRTPARARALKAGVSRGHALGEAVNFARDLGNAPANEIFPDALARRARTMVREAGGRGSGLTIQVLGEPELTKLKMGALLGVGQGSSRASRMIVVRYRPKTAAKKTIALVGKAITFDSGGLSIKPAKGMEEMKFDMCGGAAVLGAVQAIARLKPRMNVVAAVPAAENMINGSAVRPGDIVRSASGKTIEVLNTDAEGRLVLADALHYVQRFKPDYTLDFATLTGACVVALGTTVSGLMGNDPALARSIFEAGERSGDRVWELPLYQEYIDSMKSQVADLRNSGGRWGGAISAGGFLSNFVGDMKWCHLDIAGTAWTERDAGYFGLGGTGVGVRLMLELIRALS